MSPEQIKVEARKAGLRGVEDYFALQALYQSQCAVNRALSEQVRLLREENERLKEAGK